MYFKLRHGMVLGRNPPRTVLRTVQYSTVNGTECGLVLDRHDGVRRLHKNSGRALNGFLAALSTVSNCNTRINSSFSQLEVYFKSRFPVRHAKIFRSLVKSA